MFASTLRTFAVETFSHSNNLELQRHHPDTCFVTNVQNVFGYPAILAFSYPSHQIESKCATRTIFFLWKNLFAVARSQYSSSLDLSDPVIFLPPISIHTTSFGKVLYKLFGAMSCLNGFLCESVYSDVNLFLQSTILPLLWIVCVGLNKFVLNGEGLNRNEVFEDVEEISLCWVCW